MIYEILHPDHWDKFFTMKYDENVRQVSQNIEKKG